MASSKQPELPEWSPTPLAERKSQHVGHGDFLKAVVIHAVLGAGGGAWLGGVMAKSMRASQSGIVMMRSLGALVGAYAGSFRVWKKQESAALNVHETLLQYRELPDMTVDNAALEADNQILKQIIAHQKQQLESPRAQIHANSSEHSMMLAEHAQLRAVH